MNNLTISKSYLLCSLNKKGKLPISSAQIPVCLLAGGILDLAFEKCILVEKNKLVISAPLSNNMQELRTLYEFIAGSKKPKLDKIASEYCFTFSGKKINELIDSIGNSLAELKCVTVHSKGLLKKETYFIPESSAVDGVIQKIRTEIFENGILSDYVVALISLMDKSNQLKQYFSKDEKEELKVRLAEIKKDESYKLVNEMVDYVINTMVTIIIATTG